MNSARDESPETPPEGPPAPGTPIERLLAQMGRAGAGTAYVVIRSGKWDIPAHVGAGEACGVPVSYVIMKRPQGVPFTVDDAYPFLRGSVVVFGFPDVLFRPDDAFARLLERRRQRGADLVVGTVPARRPEIMDMLDLDESGAIRGIQFKPEETELERSWLLAVWSPRFTEFLHQRLSAPADLPNRARSGNDGRELYMGDLIVEAGRAGLDVETLHFEDARYADIGTPEGLRWAMEEFASWTGPARGEGRAGRGGRPEG